MTAISAGNSRITAGESDSIFLPTSYKPDGTTVGIIACHGAGATGISPVNVSLAGSYRLHRLLSRYFPVVATDLTGQYAWGNPAAQSGISAAKAYLQNVLGAKAGPVILVSISMGNVVAHNYARNNPGSVKGIIASIGVSNLTQMYSGVFQTSIGTAWGIAYPTMLPVGADPLLNPYAAPPYVDFYDTADTTVLPVDSLALATLLGGKAIPVSNFNHSEAAVAAIPEDVLLSTVLAWR